MISTTTLGFGFKGISLILLFLISPYIYGANDLEQLTDKCTVKSESGAVIIMVCDGTTEQESWREAGISVCKGRELCNVWIWLDGRDAPDAAPETDSELPKEKVALAAAVWVSDAASLMIIKGTE